MTQGPLDGLRVVDLTQVVSGAVCSMMLAEHGADVIKVEPPRGEPYRRAGHTIENENGSTNLNILRFSRGKRSITIDLKSDRGRELFRDLLAEADILVENFRPGVLARLGFPTDVLNEINPDLIYTSVSGFGHDELLDSPYNERPAYAIITEAMGGLMHLAGHGDGSPPVWMGFAMADIFSGTLAFAGTLLALMSRQSQRGGRVDIAMYDGAVLMNDLAMTAYSVLGDVMGPGQYSLQAPWGPFKAEDGYVVIAVLSEPQWRSLCDLLDRQDLKDDERLMSGQGRSRNHDDLVAPAIEAWATNRTKERAVEELLAHGVPAAPVNTSEDVFHSPQTRARNMLVEVEDPVLGPVELVGNPIKIDGHLKSNGTPRIPMLGEHTDEVLREVLGLEQDEIDDLRDAGAFGA